MKQAEKLYFDNSDNSNISNSDKDNISDKDNNSNIKVT